MRGFNRAIIAGNLTRDPDLRYTVNRRAVLSFTVAVNYRYKNNNGEYQDGADYIPVVVWGPQAESLGKFLKKGSPVLVEGQIRTRSYEAKDGSGKRYVTELIAGNVVMLGSREKNNNSDDLQNNDFPSMDDLNFTGNDGDNFGSLNEGGFNEPKANSVNSKFDQVPPNNDPETDIPF